MIPRNAGQRYLDSLLAAKRNYEAFHANYSYQVLVWLQRRGLLHQVFMTSIGSDVRSGWACRIYYSWHE